MDFNDFLGSEAVRAVHAPNSKKRLFQLIGDIATESYGISAEIAIEALLTRESLGPTGVGHGIALPHARIPDIEKVHGVFVKLDKPIDFDAVDRQPVDLIFALFAPVDSGVDHLKALALVSRTLRDNETCTKLRSNSAGPVLHTILTEIKSSQAA